MNSAIIIPARFGSTRFPGKPLQVIAGKTLLQRVCEVANEAAQSVKDCVVCVATDDQRIADHAESLGVRAIMTPVECLTGSDRALMAAQQLSPLPDCVVNLQGDAPQTPAIVLIKLLQALQQDMTADVVTPVVRLTWEELERLRENKKQTPFSGTTAIFNQQTHRALWFSKNIIPAIRKPNLHEPFSPVHQHLGVYGYRLPALRAFVDLQQSYYEQCESLEQLRFIENGYHIRVVPLELPSGGSLSGIDTPEDAARLVSFLEKQKV